MVELENRILNKELYASYENLDSKEVTVCGWVR